MFCGFFKGGWNRLIYPGLACFFLQINFISAQSRDTLFVGTLDSIVVEAQRLPLQELHAPYKINRLNQDDWQNGRRQVSLAEPLKHIPGLLVLNANNFAQDLRLSVRGFGARAAFGIRGIKIYIDGLPETTPDGQGQVDNLDAGLITGATMLSGPASGIFGNAAGGVILLNSENPPKRTFTEARITTGSYDMQRYQLKAGSKIGSFRWIAFATHTQQNGYRKHSRMQNSLFNAKVQHVLSDTGFLEWTLNYVYSPLAEDAGGLTAEEFAANPAQARNRNLSFSAGENVEQGKIGLRWQQQWSDDISLNAYGFYLFRDFSNRLPFESGGAVNLFRNFSGAGFQIKSKSELFKKPYIISAGIDLEWQSDHRKRFDNLQGTPGPLVFEQIEQFSSAGFYWLQEWAPLPDIWLMSALRYDYNELSADDKFFNDGDDSGISIYKSVSPALGISYALNANHYLYANYSYNFETPALSELSANPDGSQGFNDQLDPQEAYNYEVGVKGRKSRLSYQTAFFYLKLNNELVPFEISSNPGRFFYRNAGVSTRKGIESSLNWQATNYFSGRISYTYSDFKYNDYLVAGNQYGGNRLPGIPKHLATGGLTYTYSEKGLVILEGRYLDRIFADDANTAFSDSFFELNLRIQHTLPMRNHKWTLFGGINNLFDSEHIDNVRLNAFGGNYFEAAPGRNFYVGLGLRWSEK